VKKTDLASDQIRFDDPRSQQSGFDDRDPPTGPHMEENLLGAEPPTGTLVATTTPAAPSPAAPYTPAEPDGGWEEGTVLPRHRIGRVLGALGTVAGLSAALVPLLRVRELPDDDQSLASISTPLSLGCAAALLALVWLVAQLVRGPLDSTLWAIGCPCNRRPRTKIFARTAPGYEEVERIFRLHFDQGVEGGAQCCAYVKGQKVVELWGVRESSVPEDSYDGRSLQNIFSSTKVVTSLVVAMLVDRGHLRYEQRISELWPEFGQHGKQDITVAELMRHEGGLPKLDRPVPIDATTTAGVRGGRMAAIIAAQIPSWPAHRREYHPISRGWIANEVVVRFPGRDHDLWSAPLAATSNRVSPSAMAEEEGVPVLPVCRRPDTRGSGPTHDRGVRGAVSWVFPSCTRSILTDNYLCHACSCRK
jgi:hypothetical protein